MLDFDIKVVILVEIEISSSRTLSFDEEQNLQDLKANLGLIEEVRANKEMRSTIYK